MMAIPVSSLAVTNVCLISDGMAFIKSITPRCSVLINDGSANINGKVGVICTRCNGVASFHCRYNF